MRPAQSTATFQNVIDGFTSNPVFDNLTQAQQLQVINSALNDIKQDCKRNTLPFYKTSTLANPTALVDEQSMRTGTNETASIAGNPIVFTTPLVGSYNLILPPGVSYINPNTLVDTRTTNGFTAFAALDNTLFDYTAVLTN